MNEQKLTEMNLKQYVASEIHSEGRKAYIQSAARLLILVLAYADHVDILKYIKSIAHNLSLSLIHI